MPSKSRRWFLERTKIIIKTKTIFCCVRWIIVLTWNWKNARGEAHGNAERQHLSIHPRRKKSNEGIINFTFQKLHNATIKTISVNHTHKEHQELAFILLITKKLFRMVNTYVSAGCASDKVPNPPWARKCTGLWASLCPLSAVHSHLIN